MACGCEQAEQRDVAKETVPEVELVQTLRATLNAQTASKAFVREAKNEEFPLNSNHSIPENALWRLRSIDGRLIADVDILDTSGPRRLTVWFEMQEGRWLISGWQPLAEKTKEKTTRSTLRDLPIEFAAPALRGGPPPLVVYGLLAAPPSMARTPDAEQKSAAKIRLTVKLNRACNRKKTVAYFRSIKTQLNRCYDMMPTRKQTRHGRMTYQVSTHSTPPRIQAELIESTIVAGRLSDCVTTLLNRRTFKVSNRCSGTIRLHYRPKKKSR